MRIDRFYQERWSGCAKNIVLGKTVKEVEPGKAIHVAIFVTGYQVNGIGRTDLTGDLLIVNPDGKEILKENDCLTSEQSVKGEKLEVVLMHPVVKLSFSDQDKRSLYKIKVSVKDKVSGKSISAESAVTLKDVGKK